MNAVAIKTGLRSSKSSSKIYRVTTDIAKPVITPNGGSFTTSVEVTINCDTPNANIFYTTDGSTPSEGSARYSSPFTLNEIKSYVINAIAYNGGELQVVLATFEVVKANATKATKPQISPAGGVYTLDEFGAGIVLSSSEQGAEIYYVLNGSVEPNKSSTRYTGSPISLTAGTHQIKAIVFVDGKLAFGCCFCGIIQFRIILLF